MGDIDKKEEELEKLSVEEEITTKKVSIAEKKALIADAKKKYGRDWKKILGLGRALKVDAETMHTLYGSGLGDLKELSRFPSTRRL